MCGSEYRLLSFAFCERAYSSLMQCSWIVRVARAVIVNTCYVNTCVCISIAVLWRRVTGFICFEMEGCV